MIGKKIGDEDSAARAAWANVSVEDQIVQIHRQKVSTIDKFTFVLLSTCIYWCGSLRFDIYRVIIKNLTSTIRRD